MALSVDHCQGVIIFKVITVSNIHENKGLTFKLIPKVRTFPRNHSKTTASGNDNQSHSELPSPCPLDVKRQS